jgi:hypothetical protein
MADKGNSFRLGCGVEALLYIGLSAGLLAALFWSSGADLRAAVLDGLTYAFGGYCALISMVVIVLALAGAARRR